jgi:hypothetical protein
MIRLARGVRQYERRIVELKQVPIPGEHDSLLAVLAEQAWCKTAIDKHRNEGSGDSVGR